MPLSFKCPSCTKKHQYNWETDGIGSPPLEMEAVTSTLFSYRCRCAFHPVVVFMDTSDGCTYYEAVSREED